MSVMGGISDTGYSPIMPPRSKVPLPTRSPGGRKAAPEKPKRVYPNRIRELMKRRGLTNAELGDRIGAHEVTISNLATGEMKLTYEWMKKLSAALNVAPAEIIEAPPTGLRRVRVKGLLQAGVWNEGFELPVDEQIDVMVPDDTALHNLPLYAGIVAGESMNLIYPPGTIVVMSRIEDETGPWMAAGRRYHVRQTKADGMVEETLKTLTKDDQGKYWLKPESSSPQFQNWVPIEGDDGTTIQLVGRVRYAVRKED